ncbi:MAG: hypothetical protein WCA11_04415 [Terracidiphilus sp.]
MNTPSPAPVINLSFPHNWQAEVLASRPLILPKRHYIYPRDAEEVERGALEVLIHPNILDFPGLEPAQTGPPSHIYRATSQREQEVSGHDFSRAEIGRQFERALAPEESPSAQEFLATCALGFRDPAVPTGLWSTPNPDEICAVSGGYAYLIRTNAPEQFAMLPYRPVLGIRPLPAHGLLLFVGHHALLAWGEHGQAWQSEKLSDEGITLTAIENNTLHGQAWNMHTDKEIPFAIDLRTGQLVPEARS